MRVTVEQKPFWQSKTFWVNVIGLVSMVSGVPVEPQVQMGVLGVLNIILRFITKSPVKF